MANPTPKASAPIQHSTPKEVAEHLQIDPSQVLRWAKAGIIPASFHVGRVWRFLIPDVDKALAEITRKNNSELLDA